MKFLAFIAIDYTKLVLSSLNFSFIIRSSAAKSRRHHQSPRPLLSLRRTPRPTTTSPRLPTPRTFTRKPCRRSVSRPPRRRRRLLRFPRSRKRRNRRNLPRPRRIPRRNRRNLPRPRRIPRPLPAKPGHRKLVPARTSPRHLACRGNQGTRLSTLSRHR